MARRFKIEDTIIRQYRRFGATGTQLVVRLLPPADAVDPVNHSLASLDDLFRHALHNLSASDMVGITIQNRENQNDKPIGICFRRKDQVAGMLYCLWSKRFHNQTLDLTFILLHLISFSCPRYGVYIKQHFKLLRVVACRRV
jgi:hypothetical protein